MMNNEIKMAALNDDELENVVGGFDVKEDVYDPSKEAVDFFIENVVKVPVYLADKLANKLLQIFG